MRRNAGRRDVCRRLVVYPASAMAGLLLFSGMSQPAPSTHQVSRADADHMQAGTKTGPVIAAVSGSGRDSGSSRDEMVDFVVGSPQAGVPVTVLDAYRRAAAAQSPSCGLSWPLLAGIGKVESNNARNGDVSPNGELRHPILGPALDGSAGTAAVPNTIGTQWGQSGPWERAVGPMQFLPGTWQRWGADGNADGTADPNNVYDAALAAGRYLCSAGGDLSTPAGLDNAIFSYNHSAAYVAEVLSWMRSYQSGGGAVPDDPSAFDLGGFIPPASEGQSDVDTTTNPPAVPRDPSATAPPSAAAPPKQPPAHQPPPSAPPASPPSSLPGPVGQVVTVVKTVTGGLLPPGALQNTLNTLLP